MAFRGWKAEALDFFDGLEADNSKTYWQAHKPEYESLVRAPMEELLRELAREFGEGKIFRPYRDTRFSADKTPYKTNIAAVLAKGGYISLSADTLGCGNGMWMMMPDQLDRFRKAVDDDRTGKALEKLVADAVAKGIEVGGHDALKTAPRGYAKDHPRIDLLRAKGFVTWRQWPVGAWLGTARAKDRLVEFLRASQPINKWPTKNVGPTSMTDNRFG
jgi:uncharacterized protein (TIGR02453 family)